MTMTQMSPSFCWPRDPSISHGTDHACSQQTPLCCKWATCMPFLTAQLSPPAQPSLPACTVGGRIDPNPEWVGAGAGMPTDTSGCIEEIFCKQLSKSCTCLPCNCITHKILSAAGCVNLYTYLAGLNSGRGICPLGARNCAISPRLSWAA